MPVVTSTTLFPVETKVDFFGITCSYLNPQVLDSLGCTSFLLEILLNLGSADLHSPDSIPILYPVYRRTVEGLLKNGVFADFIYNLL